ncbi:polysaccharide deacetylase family protein [Cellulosilyticum sp. ST5]|uniref:polysaccharide deacetylase family protein n=1 Tax=unclassified Cellulosilyticum TaxID=2643091 RepID=UPI000F8E324B|nr:polysaccharide deacetylase family protein [Cellulosilyticum sp. WCF-2]QEH70129.1 polysaccharide deacetylase family protein [Cellulosilyticum sp. WCF-2]
MKNIKKYLKRVVAIGLAIMCSLPVLGAPTKKLPIYCVNTNGEKKVALSFDAAWGADDTDELLATLDKYQVKATFFIVGDWVRKYPDMVKKLADAGHDIANHSNKHPHMNQMSKDAIKKDIMAAHEALKNVTGQEANLFRPPYGEYNNAVIEAAQECNYYTVQWDVDSLDWKEYGLQQLIDKVVKHKNLRPGSIVLLHNNAKYTAKALDSIIKGLIDQGYTLVPISELILKDVPYTLDHEGRQQPVR